MDKCVFSGVFTLKYSNITKITHGVKDQRSWSLKTLFEISIELLLEGKNVQG